jgi:hypothetical protein
VLRHGSAEGASLHREINLEAKICDRMVAAGRLHSEGDAGGYVRVRARFPADALAWVPARPLGHWRL